MSRVILFDVNETLLDLGSLRPHFVRTFGEPVVLEQWFALLLHSSLVTTLAGVYADFGSLADAALDIVAFRRDVSLAKSDRDAIIETVSRLSPHPEVPKGLDRLRAAGLRLAALTNSPPHILSQQMLHSGLGAYFEQLLSVDTVRRFKPASETYHMAARELGVSVQRMRLVAAHDWDVFGALRAGCRGAFIARAGSKYHPLYEKPDVIGADLVEVTDQILQIDV